MFQIFEYKWKQRKSDLKGIRKDTKGPWFRSRMEKSDVILRFERLSTDFLKDLQIFSRISSSSVRRFPESSPVLYRTERQSETAKRERETKEHDRRRRWTKKYKRKSSKRNRIGDNPRQQERQQGQTQNTTIWIPIDFYVDASRCQLDSNIWKSIVTDLHWLRIISFSFLYKEQTTSYLQKTRCRLNTFEQIITQCNFLK